MSTAAPKHFDANLCNRLGQTEEIQMETRRPGSNTPVHRTTTWIVVVGDDVYVRSVRGNAGRWYQEIKANPAATVHVDGQRVPVRAIPVSDDATIKQVSDAYRQKYGNSPYMPPMLRDEVLPTTLRLEPQ